MNRHSVFLGFFLLMVPIVAASDSIRFQGRLTDNQGRPITESPQVRFQLYPALTGGSVVWQSAAFQPVSTNDAGLFSTDIGPLPDSLFTNGADLYLQIIVKGASGDQTLAPRQKLGNVPYAFHAHRASTAAVAETIPDGSITAEKIQSEAVDSSAIKDGSIQQVDLSTALASQVLPSGMISMFARNCPTGWTRFGSLDDRFPIGVASYSGVPSGSWEVSGLSASTEGVHTHQSLPHSHAAGNLTATPLTTRNGYVSVSGGTWTPKDNPTIQDKRRRRPPKSNLLAVTHTIFHPIVLGVRRIWGLYFVKKIERQLIQSEKNLQLIYIDLTGS